MATVVADRCVGCGDVPALRVYLAPDGWCIGLACACGEQQRRSRVFPTQADAATALRILQHRGDA